MAYIYGAIMVLILITFLFYKKKVLRIITNSPLKAHCRPMFRSTNILTVINQFSFPAPQLSYLTQLFHCDT